MFSTANQAQPSIARFDSWNEVASVRAKPRRRFDDAHESRLYFSPDLLPILHHPLVAALGEDVRDRILVERLYQYLDVTTWVEQGLVNSGLMQLFQGELPLRLPARAEFDAYKIYCDEGYHALFSVDLKNQVADRTGISWSAGGEPHVLRALNVLRQSVAPGMRTLAQFFFVIVYETLISGILARVPRDRRVTETVRRVVQDHAEDEGRHHAYFSDMFRMVWPGLEPAQRDAIGPLLAPAIVAALEPDREAIDALLMHTGFDEEQRGMVIADSYPPARIRSDIRSGGAATIHLIRRNGAFGHVPTRAAFLAHELIAS